MLEELGMRLHAKNRIGGGESGYLWLLAEAIRGAGRMARRAADRTELDKLYGDADCGGTLTKREQVDHFSRLLWEQSADLD